MCGGDKGTTSSGCIGVLVLVKQWLQHVNVCRLYWCLGNYYNTTFSGCIAVCKTTITVSEHIRTLLSAPPSPLEKTTTNRRQAMKTVHNDQIWLPETLMFLLTAPPPQLPPYTPVLFLTDVMITFCPSKFDQSNGCTLPWEHLMKFHKRQEFY